MWRPSTSPELLEGLLSRLEKEGEDPARFPTAEGLAEQWLELLREVLKG